MEGLKVICPQCRRSFFTTTNKYDPSVPPTGAMLKPTVKYHLDWLPVSGTKAAELSCPECLGQLAHGGRLVVDIPQTEPDSGVGLDAVIVDGAEKHTCPVCGKECKSKLGLNGHMRSHEGKE